METGDPGQERLILFTAGLLTRITGGNTMSDEMINKTTPMPKKGVDGIGDTTSVHYMQWDMNYMNNPVESPESPKSNSYSKGQSKKGA